MPIPATAARRVLVAVALVTALAGCTHGSLSAPPPSATPSSPGGSAAPATGSTQAPAKPVAWRIPPADAHGIEGYANRTSVAVGEPVTLYVSTRAQRFRVRALRMGWYGGNEAAQTWVSGLIAGRQQPGPAVLAAATHTMWANWTASLTIATTGWQPGDYLLRLEAGPHQQAFVPLTVRGPTAAGRVVVISPVTTWQAYNLWGCCDLYTGADGSFGTRARAVSFDRPYSQEGGAGDFLYGELGIVVEVQRLHLPVDYVTDIDLEQNPHLLDGAKAVLSVGHDEYWSPTMRAALQRARDSGANIASFGANAIFRRIRFGATRLGPDRLEINYKVADEDPLYGRDNPAVTANWPAPPDANPESSLLGDQYACVLASRKNDAGVVVEPSSWFYAGTHVTSGEKLPGLIGPETDAVQTGYPTPHPIEVIMHSPTHCANGSPPYADASYYVAPSGAGVFDAGTISWTCAVIRACAGQLGGPTHVVVRQVTDNILRAFATGPAGRQHPAG